MKQEFTRIAVKVGSNVLTRRDGTLDVTSWYPATRAFLRESALPVF